MEQKIKIIKLDNKPTNKKQLYKDILASSSKVNELIKKTKRNKFNFKKNKKPFEPKINRVEPKINSVEPKINRVEPKINRVEPKINRVEPKINRVEPKINRVEPKIEYIEKKTKCNKKQFIKYKNVNPPKKSLKKNINSKYKSKKIFYKNSSILKYFDSKKKQSINIFSKKEIDKFINVMNHYSEYENYKHIHKYIKKLNKYQTIQILYTLKLIFKKSNAPVALLKNILYNYFLCNIIIN